MNGGVYSGIPVGYPLPVSKFPAALRSYRERFGWTQEHLSRSTGISQSQISKFENAQAEPNMSEMTALGRALCVTVEKLVEGHDPRYDLACQNGEVELPRYLQGGADVPASARLQRHITQLEAQLADVEELARQLLKRAIGPAHRDKGRASSAGETKGRGRNRKAG